MCISRGKFDSIFSLNYALFELRNLRKMKDTTETVGQHTSSETAPQNCVKLCTMCRYAFLQEMLIWSFWGAIYIPFFVRLPVTNAWNCHSLYTAFSSNVGAWGMWACSLFLSFIHCKPLYIYDIILLNTYSVS